MDVLCVHTREVELYFATNAMTFIVGWCWICLCRDLTTLVSASLVGDGPRWARYVTTALCTFVAGPLVGVLAELRRR